MAYPPMSFGLTGAIAGALNLEQPTVCITGDAGLGMVMGELSLLTELQLTGNCDRDE